jgi:hypothetical protein
MADDQVPPTFAGAAQSALAGGEAAPAPPSAPAPVAPAPQPGGYFGRILQGALNGLSGGLRQGQENIAGAGTRGFTPGGNGGVYAQQLQDKQDQAVRQQQVDANAQSQQQFENQSKQFQLAQQQKMQQVQATQAKLASIHMEQNIQQQDQETQDKYYAGQSQYMQSVIDGGGKEVDHVKAAPGQSIHDAGAAYVQAHPGVMSDPNTHLTFSKDADGTTEVHVMNGDPNAQVDNATTQARLTSIGSGRQLGPGSMKVSDANHLYSAESSKMADQHHADNMEQLKFKQQQQLSAQNNAQTSAREFGLEKMKEAATNAASGGTGADSPAATLGEGIVHSGLTEDAIPGFAKAKPAVQAYLSKTYPNLDQSSVILTGSDRRLKNLSGSALQNLDVIQSALQKDPTLIGKIQGRITGGELKVGTNDPELGAIKNALDNYGLAATGAHGIRSEAARADAKEALLNSFKNGPDAVTGSMSAARASLTHLNQLGRPQPMDPTKDLKGNPLPKATQQPTSGTSQGHAGMKQQRNKTTGETRWVPAQ